MLIRRCKNCNSTFEAQVSGRMAIVCRSCSLDCDLAYPKIHAHLLENPDLRVVDKDKIAEAVDVSPVFVWLLSKEGRFGGLLDESNGDSKCMRCKSDLKEAEKELCFGCAQRVSDTLRAGLTGQKNYLDQYKRAAPTTPKKEKRYGLGR